MSSNTEDGISKQAQMIASPAEGPRPLKSTNGRFRRWFSWGSKSEDQQLLRRLDIFIMSWACYGYFIRLLDTSNMSNAYVSGMKEDLDLKGDEYNLFTTYWTIGYIIGMIPSQIIFTRFRPSTWLPFAELIWAIVTFCFAAVKTPQQVYALRFLVGLFESPFYVGAMTLLGNWYTPKELATRAGIFYSASFAASMFSGYLQAAVYSGLDGSCHLSGWRWLFIMCGIITVPGAIWGFFAVPDSPYDSKVFYLSREQVALAKARMVKEKRDPFKGIGIQTFKSILAKPFTWVFIINYIFFCLVTAPPSYFAIYLKSLKIFTVPQINTIPTAGQAFGFLATIIFGFISDKLQNRISVALAVTLLNMISGALLAANKSIAGNFVGYILNSGTYVYGPLMITFLAEIFTTLADERALILGCAQTMGATFGAWVPLLIFNTGAQAPLFKTGYLVITILASAQAVGVVLMWYLGKRIVKEAQEAADHENEVEPTVVVLNYGKERSV